jgi:hypothetical protein
VKAEYLMPALEKVITDGTETGKFILDHSQFMTERWSSEVAHINNDMHEIMLNPNGYEKLREFAGQNAYFLQRVTQSLVDRAAWVGAFNQAIAKGTPEADAVAIADGTVRETQGSNAPEDISNIEAQNAFIRLFVQFYGYWNTIGNLGLTEAEIAVRTTGFQANAGRLFYAYTVAMAIPSIVAAAMVKAAGGGLDDEDEDGYLDEVTWLILGSQVRGALALVPGGQVGNVIMNAFTRENWYDDNLNVSPVMGAIERMAKTPGSVYGAVFKEGGKGRAVKDVLTLFSLLSGMPVTAAARPLGYLADVYSGEEEPSGPIDFTRGILTGRRGLKER